MNTNLDSVNRHPNPTRKQTRRNSPRVSSFQRLTLFTALSLFGVSSAEAAVFTWAGGGTNNNWANAGNFSPALPAAPGNIDIDLVFADSARPTSVSNRGANFLVNSFTFTNSANAQTLNQNTAADTILLSQSSTSELPLISHQGTGNATFNTLPLILGANATVDKTGASGNITFTSVISETGGARSLSFTGAGGGVASLNGVNTYTGGTTIGGSYTVQVNNEGASFGSLGSVNSSVTLTSGQLRFIAAGGITLASTRNVILGNGTINTNGGNNTIAGVLSGTNLTKIGAGILTLTNGANAYTGSTSIQNGTLQLSGAGVLPTTTVVSFGQGTNNGTLDLNGKNQTVAGLAVVGTTTASQVIGNSSLTTDSILTVNSVAPSTFGGTIQDAVSGGARTVGLALTGGSLTLSGDNTNTGGTSIATGATLQIGAGGTTGQVLGNIVNNGTLVHQRSDNVVVAGSISGGGIFTQNGTGVVALTGANNFSAVNASAGTLIVQPTAIAGTPAITVSSGANFVITNPTATTTVPVTSLALGADNLSTNTLTINLNGNPTGAALTVGNSGGLVSNGTTTINVGNGAIPLTTGLKPLISYVGAISGTSNAAPDYGFVLGTLPSRALGSLVTSNPGLIELNITSIDTIKWTGADGTNPSWWDINATTNWALASNAAPTNYLETSAPGDTVTFDGSAVGPKTVDLRTTVSPAAITVNTSGGDYTFTGTGGIAGTGSLLKQGAGTLNFVNSGANTFVGGTTVNAGNIRIGNGNDSSSLAGNVSLAALTKLELNPGATAITIAGNITGSGALDLLSNLAILTGTGNTYSGGTTIAAGTTLQIGNGTISGSLPSAGLVNNGTLAFNPGPLNYEYDGNITSGSVSILGTNTTILTGTGNTYLGGTTIAAGAKLQIGDGGTSNGSLPGNVTNDGELIFRPVANFTYAGNISGTGLVRATSGSTLLKGLFSYAGTTNVGSGATLQLGDGTNPVALTGNVVNAGTLAINASNGNLAYGGVISGAGALNILAGEVTLNAANTYTGQTSIAAGATVRAGIVNSLSAATILNVASGATYDANSLNSRSAGLSGSGNITLGTNPATIFTINGNNTTTFNGVISGEGGLSRLNGGTQILGNNNTYTGTTNIQNDNAQIRIAVDNALPVGTTLTFLGTTNVNVIFDLNGKNQTIAALTGATNNAGTAFIQNNSGAGTSVLTITNGTGSFGNTPNANGRARLRDNDGVALGGKVALTITGGTTTFKDAQTYTGPTTISGGSYKLGRADAVSSSSDFIIIDTGNIDLSGFNATLLSLTGNGTATGTGGILSVIGGNFSGLVTGGIGLTKANPGTFTLSGTSNDFTGVLQVNNGVLELFTLADSGAGANGNGAIQIVNNTETARLKYLGGATSITRGITIFGNGDGGNAILDNSGTGALEISGPVTASGTGNAKTLTLAGTNTALNTLSGVISNGPTAIVSVGKSDAGTWELTGDNTYTGGTTISGGTLQVGPGGTVGNGTVTNNATFNVARAGLTTAAITGTGTTNVTAASATLTATSIRQSVLAIGATSTGTLTPSLGNKPTGISVFTNTAGTSLSIAAGGNFDTNDNDLIVYYQAGTGATTLATIKQQILDGFLGTSGVAKISSTTGTVDGDKYLVAFDNSVIGLTDWEGITLTGTNQIIAKYTLFGDLNLDGTVNAFDYSSIDTNFGTGTDWLTGDANLDGVVDAFDYSVIDSNFGKSFPSLGAGPAPSLSIRAVPEPSMLVRGGLAVLGLGGWKLRRKRRQAI